MQTLLISRKSFIKSMSVNIPKPADIPAGAGMFSCITVKNLSAMQWESITGKIRKGRRVDRKTTRSIVALTKRKMYDTMCVALIIGVRQKGV